MPAPTPDCATIPRRSGALPGTALVAAALLGTMLLGGCETVSLNTPAPVEVMPAASAALPTQPAPASAPAAQVPPAQAQGLQASPGVQVMPLAPASAASLPALPASAASAAAPAPASSLPAASVPGSSAAAAASAPAAPASLPASALPPGAVRYVCNDGTSFLASFGDVSVTMSTALGVMELEQTVAADGARYANGEVQVWFKGRQATITNLRSPGSQVLCLEQR